MFKSVGCVPFLPLLFTIVLDWAMISTKKFLIVWYEWKLSKLLHYAGQVILKINFAWVGDKFCYLGSIISKNCGVDSDVKPRIKKARKAFGCLSNICKPSKILQHIKIKRFRSNALIVLLYGYVTWKVTDTGTHSLQIFVNCQRSPARLRYVKSQNFYRDLSQLPNLPHLSPLFL